MRSIFLILVLLTGCSNVSTTKLYYSDVEGRTFSLEFPKEMEAKDIQVVLNVEKGTVTIVAKELITLNAETIKAQAKREEIASEIAEKVTKAGVEAAIKSIVPVP